MVKNKSIKLNFLMNIVLTLSSFIFPLITFPYASRVLTQVGTGRVAFATSLIAYFNMIAQLGIPTYGIRACAKVRDDKEKLTRTAQELIAINIFMSVFSYICLGLALMFIPRLYDDRELYIIISLTIFLTSIGMEWLYKALEQYTYITVRSLVFKIISIILMFMLVHSKEDYVIYGAITIFAGSASNIMNLYNAHHFIGMKPVGNYNFRKHLKPIGIFFAMATAATVYTNLDVVMLGFMTTDADVGYYNAAVRIKNILVSIVTSLGAVLLPRVSYYVEQNRMEEFKTINKKALNFVFFLAVPFVVYFTLFAKEGIYFLASSLFDGSIVPMQIIMPTVLLIGITNIIGIQMLVPLNKEKYVLYSVVAGAIVDVIINALLIPRYQSAGAAIGTLIAEIVVLIVQCILVRKYADNLFSGIQYWKIAVGAFVGGIVSLFALKLNGGEFLKLVCSSIMFFGMYAVILFALKEKMMVYIFETIQSRFLKLKH